MITLLSIALTCIVCCAWWHAGYAKARIELIRACAVALKHGHARCEMTHGDAVQRGYTMAHADLIDVIGTVSVPRWWHAFRRPPVVPKLPSDTKPLPKSRGGLTLC